MREATANYLQEEARPRGAKPRVRAVIYPFDLDLGLAGSGGTFTNTEYGGEAGKLAMQAGYFLTGSWISPVMQAYTPNLAAPAWIDQAGYMTVAVSLRTAATYEGVAGASWVPVTSGGEYDLSQYYQVKVDLNSTIRAWAVDEAGDADAYSAYAVDSAPDPGYDSYASDGEFPGNLQQFILTGKMLLPESEIFSPGDVNLEMAIDFQNLRTGSNRLVLDNRSRQWIPGGPNFYLRAIPWYKKQLKLYHGYELPGGQVEWQLVYIGQLQTISGMAHAWEGAHLAHLETDDYIRILLDKKIGVPDADGTKRPFMRGYYRAKAESTGTTDASCTVVKIGSGVASLHVVDQTKYSGQADVNYLVQADSTGEVGAATFRWSKDNGQTWEKTGITTEGQGNQVTLENGLEVYFESAPGTDLVSGDQWIITAQAKVVHYKIPGAPFQAITSVWVQDDDSRQGVIFSENSGEIWVKGAAGSVEARVVKDDTTHPVDIIEDILAAVGLSEFINADAFALAKSDTLFYHIGVCFADLEAGRAIREICSRCLFDFWVDCGEIKVRAYLGEN
ncbi:MAG: hypothetical protein C4567_12420 [Deltaproteobacteria bacterium]|nr:MAG: hypothetical protein C4567_12420 [Deltaproteobacteria bacterium]